MKRCILLAISFVLLLGLIACAAVPEDTVPGTTAPEVTAPKSTEPTEPKVTEPKVTEPEVTEPTEPEVTEPTVTEPSETEDTSTDSAEMVTVSMLTHAKTISYWPNEHLYSESVLEYDQDYNLLEVKMYHDGRLVYGINYDKNNGKPLGDQYYNPDGSTYHLFDVSYTYDQNGKVLTMLSYFAGEPEYLLEYTYDEDGKLWKVVKYQYFYDEQSGEVTSEPNTVTKHYYNPEGQLVAVESLYDGGWLFEHTEYTYHENGQLAEKYTHDYYARTTCSYDIHGNLVSRTIDYADRSRTDTDERYEYSYENGVLREKKVYNNGDLEYHYQYDSAGNLLLRYAYIFPEIDGKPFFDKYEYDENGRLIRHIESNFGNDCQRYETTTTWDYDENGNLACKRWYSFEELVSEYVPVYETVTVTPEQAAKIEEVNQEIFQLPEDNC